MALAQSPEDISELRRKLEAQEALVRQQQELMKKQQEALDSLTGQIEDLKKRIDQMEQQAAAPAPVQAPAAVDKKAAAPEISRDAVGDLNSRAVEAGSFPGSFVIPGTRNVSLGIGGFIKTVAIADSNAEALGSNMLPSTLGTQRGDTGGKFAMDATLTRLLMDARAPAGSGSLRGYIEYDLNAGNNNSLGFKLRHAYGTWQTGSGTLTMGHTWSTFMDLGILPEGLTEPTLSGAIFMRQAQLRWTQKLGEGLKADFSVEDPSSGDILSDSAMQSRTRMPDCVAAAEYANKRGHVRLGGIVRRLELANEDDSLKVSTTGWGLSLGAHINTFGKDRLTFSGSYGKGLGRYLLGLGSTDGGALNTEDHGIKLRDNYAGLVWYQHMWNSRLRSTAAAGHARSDPFASQNAGTFESTTYAYGNLMWTVLPYLNLGFEYDYGRRDTKGDTHKDNHRIMFGMQIF